jgi:hypothetical protein
MITEKVQSFIQHYGVRGQKWGVRKPREGPGSTGDSGSKKSSSGGKHLSDEQLKKAIDRMRLEQQYNELSNPRKKSGGAFAKGLLENSGRLLITAVVGAVGTIGVGKAFGASIAKQEAAKEIAKRAMITAAEKAASGG